MKESYSDIQHPKTVKACHKTIDVQQLIFN